MCRGRCNVRAATLMPTGEWPIYVPIISFKPSITLDNSSGTAFLKRFPILSTERVLIWLILTQERFGKPFDFSSNVSGKPARCGWLESATAITVPERSLKISWLTMRTV